MKKTLFLIINCFLIVKLSQCTSQDVVTEESSDFGYVPRYDRGYWGNDYSRRIDFLSGKLSHRGDFWR
ncbi:MAG: hypothetical protein K2X90_03365 [Candidatus Babeliaceae bacterium]|nr:hypothetical protein [Candidatus Babeliaceae bacterium]